MKKSLMASEIELMDTFMKLEIIERILQNGFLNEKQIDILNMLSFDEDVEIRSRVAEALVLSNTILAEPILVRLMRDNNELVRVNACDSLCASNSPEILALLKDRVLKDKSSLVRGYAALSIADIAKRINYSDEELLRFYNYVLDQEKVGWVKISLYKVMYMLGDQSKLCMLMNGLNDRLYRNRCATINSLVEVASNINYSIIKGALDRRLLVEKSGAVISGIKKALQNMPV